MYYFERKMNFHKKWVLQAIFGVSQTYQHILNQVYNSWFSNNITIRNSQPIFQNFKGTCYVNHMIVIIIIIYSNTVDPKVN